jgi:hypothetical protein
MSVSRHHADWLSLVECSGPFVSLPVLLRVFPQGLDPRDPEQAKQLRLAYEEWQENPNLAAKQRAWIMHVLTQVLLHPKELLAEGQTLPPGLMATMAEYGEILRPELALLGPIGSDLSGKPQLMMSLYPAEQSLDKPVAGKHWKATPGTRMMELLHATDIPLGLVTNGEEWMLVFAPHGDTTDFTSWYASLWIDEPITLSAFHSLLSTRRFFGVAPSDTLLALLKESAQDQQEVTNQLGDQVRDAVEVLIQAFDGLDQDSGRTLLKGVDEKSLYDSALTVMMRLVFLFSAEERGLLHLGEPLYDENYAVSTLREQLQEVADHYGEEVLERRHDGWARLLASFRAVHGGVNHQDLMLPAYGGSLFDPDRYPFLEGRAQGTRWQSSLAAPLEINNRVVLHLLKSLQMLQVKVPGGPAEALRVSFEGLNIEQIGHVYEGLLDHTALRAKEVVLGLAASRKKPVASITLAELETLRQDDEAKLIEALEEETGRYGKALEKALKNGGEPEDFHKLLVASSQDKVLAERIMPFRGLLRQDSFERLVVVLPGGIYVGHDSTRRSTGTHYTERSLTEPIVRYTLEPLVYSGPVEGLSKEQWRLKSPKDILELKVCDMAMGSGAFLVQTCRYLSERLVEAWENLEKEHPSEVLITPEGGFSQGEPSERLIPKEAEERLAIARRLVADRCIYGVDINPMAVEMAKLSIWLITVDKSRPFTFLDHALKCGDSLLGICGFKQLETFSLDYEHAQQVVILSNYEELIRIAIVKRRELEMLPSNNATQIEAKKALLDEAEARLEKLKRAADLLIAAEMTEGRRQKKEMARAAAHLKVTQYFEKSIGEFRYFAQEQLEGRRTLHWPLEFPEVFEQGGFHAFVGNPPFIAGTAISTYLGGAYKSYLKSVWPHLEGRADICVVFMLRGAVLARAGAGLGFIGSNTTSETDSRISGPAFLLRNGFAIYRAVKSMPWPGSAAVFICQVHYRKGGWNGDFVLDGAKVDSIDSAFDAAAEVSEPFLLRASQDKSFTGTKVYGDGFILSPAEAEVLLQEDVTYRKVVKPYLIGRELNDDPDCRPARFIIDFTEMDQSEAQRYPSAWSLLERRVKEPRQEAPEARMREVWWQFQRPRRELYEKLAELRIAWLVAATSDTIAFVGLPFSEDSPTVFSHAVNVLALDGFGEFAVVQSSIHMAWARWRGSSLKGDSRYTTTDCFENFPLPLVSSPAEQIGQDYHEFRGQVMASRREGLTKIYNRFHDPKEDSAEVARLRTLQVEMDQAVASTYGWSDLALDHGFHSTRQAARFTISESARRAVLDRLLDLNHQRYEGEVRAGLHEKGAKSAGGKGKKKIQRAVAQGELL